jgi:hypothetical protein
MKFLPFSFLLLALSPQGGLGDSVRRAQSACGGGTVGNGIYADPLECCSELGWCGISAEHCGGYYTPPLTSPTLLPEPSPTLPPEPSPTTPPEFSASPTPSSEASPTHSSEPSPTPPPELSPSPTHSPEPSPNPPLSLLLHLRPSPLRLNQSSKVSAMLSPSRKDLLNCHGGLLLLRGPFQKRKQFTTSLLQTVTTTSRQHSRRSDCDF